MPFQGEFDSLFRQDAAIAAAVFVLVILAAGVALIWLGLAFGEWLPIIAVIPLLAALGVELAARRS